MVEYGAVNIAGIEEEDGTVTCRNCMDEEQWLTFQRIKLFR